LRSDGGGETGARRIGRRGGVRVVRANVVGDRRGSVDRLAMRGWQSERDGTEMHKIHAIRKGPKMQYVQRTEGREL
jgi:hypothetical protein